MFGERVPEDCEHEPGFFVQLALQLAHYNASIRRFHLGRVDVIHAASMAALQWNEQKLKLLREAIEHQTEHMLKTILGHGVDNHMLGLRVTAESVMGKLPDLFTDPVYVECNQFRLSTSQHRRVHLVLARLPESGHLWLYATERLCVRRSKTMHEMIQANVELAKINTVSTEVENSRGEFGHNKGERRVG
uniref:Choline O-acetyltransferase n=1 Tax=Macrostomum lignano TaxID=282301 RepID=A0A1I8FIM6_9PLAT